MLVLVLVLQAVVTAFLSSGVGGAVLAVGLLVGEEVVFLSRGDVGAAGKAFPITVPVPVPAPLTLLAPLPPEKNLASAAVFGETLAFGDTIPVFGDDAAIFGEPTAAGDRNPTAVLLGDGAAAGTAAAAVPWNLARLSTIRGEQGGASAGRSLLPTTASATGSTAAVVVAVVDVVVVVVVGAALFDVACLIGDDEEGGDGDGAGGVRGALGATGAVRGDGAVVVDAAGAAAAASAGSTSVGAAAGTEGAVVDAAGDAAAAVAAVTAAGDDAAGDLAATVGEDGAAAAGGSTDTTLLRAPVPASTLAAPVHADPAVAWLLLL